ncbi:MAG: tRNA lysidine(34) synthetase TilS [Sphingomonadales bacterium]
MTAPPLDAQWFGAALVHAAGNHGDFAPGSAAPVALAVSGGPDSMALALLAAEALGRSRLRALTVDHRLRPQAAAEARWVAQQMAARGIAHHILTRTDAPLGGNLQDGARQARYRLLEDWCAAQGVAWLITAHHQTDQAETLLLRLARGSGVDGLAAMAPMRPALTRPDGPWLLRPLLAQSPAALRAYLTARGQGWVEDPSNRDRGFERVRARALLADPPLEGLTPARLAGVATAMRRARAALAHYTQAWLERAVAWRATGDARLDLAGLEEVPDEIALRGLAMLVMAVAGNAQSPRLAPLQRVLAALRTGRGVARTLAGVQIWPEAGAATAVIAREPAAAGRDVRRLLPGQSVLWDGRFQIALDPAAPACSLRALGQDGWQAICAHGRPDVAYKVALSQPSLWRRGRLLAAPTLASVDCHPPAAAWCRAEFSPRRPILANGLVSDHFSLIF